MFSKVLEISSISGVFLLDLSDFLLLVEVQEELLAIQGLSLTLLLGIGSTFWTLVADEGVDGSTFFMVKLDTFDFTVLFKVGLELLFSGVLWEVLDVEIASLLGVLESVLLSLLLLLSESLWKSFFNVELDTIVLLVVLLSDSVQGAFWTVFFVVWVFETNEGEWCLFVGTLDLAHHDNSALDGTILAKDLLNLFLIPVTWEILDVDVVEGLSEFSSVLWLIWVDFELELTSFIESLLG